MITLIVLILIYTAVVCKKNKLYKELYYYLENKNYNEFQLKINSKSAQVFLSNYLKETMMLTMYIDLKDRKQIMNQYNKLLKMKQSQLKKNNLMVSAFHYFCSIRDKKQCSKILEYIDIEMNNQYKLYKRHFDIIIEKSTKYIDELKKEITTNYGIKKGYLEYLLAISYQSKKDDKYKEYFTQAAKDYHIGEDQLETAIRVI